MYNENCDAENEKGSSGEKSSERNFGLIILNVHFSANWKTLKKDSFLLEQHNYKTWKRVMIFRHLKRKMGSNFISHCNCLPAFFYVELLINEYSSVVNSVRISIQSTKWYPWYFLFVFTSLIIYPALPFKFRKRRTSHFIPVILEFSNFLFAISKRLKNALYRLEITVVKMRTPKIKLETYTIIRSALSYIQILCY